MRFITTLSTAASILALTTISPIAAAQSSASDPSARLAAVLPADVARQVLSVIDAARADHLPSDALANRSLKFAARGIDPQNIAHAATDQLTRLRSARDILRSARRESPDSDEIEAGAEALRQGVHGSDVASLAKSAPSGRSLAVPLYVIGSLVSRGLPSDQALQRVQTKLAARASDADIEASGRGSVASAQNQSSQGRGRAADAGRAGGQHGASSGAHGPPAGIPGNAGSHGRSKTAGHGRPPATGNGHP
jgi:hypothetical protein